jgi:hypothetical protein
MTIKYEWDGEKIKQTITQTEKKLTPKEILDALDQIRGQIGQVEHSKTQAQQQIHNADINLENLNKAKKDLKDYEDKCIELQKEKLGLYIKQISEECIKKAKEEAEKEIAKDPNAYKDGQKSNLPYLKYQRNLATHEKVAKNISKRVWTKYLYEEPIFKNPFED